MVSGKDFALHDAKVGRAGWGHLVLASSCLESGHDAKSSSNHFATMRQRPRESQEIGQ